MYELQLHQKLDRILCELADIRKEVQSMTPQLQALSDQVAANSTVTKSALALINGLAAQILASVNDPAALTALAASLKNDDDSLAAAVSANTPAAPAPPATS